MTLARFAIAAVLAAATFESGCAHSGGGLAGQAALGTLGTLAGLVTYAGATIGQAGIGYCSEPPCSSPAPANTDLVIFGGVVTAALFAAAIGLGLSDQPDAPTAR